MKRIGLVKPADQGRLDPREFKAKEAPAALQDAPRFGERAVDARHVANAEGDRIGVESIVGKRQILGVGLHEFKPCGQVLLFRPRAADLKHVGVDVEHRDFGLRAARPRDAEGDVAGAARDVEMAEFSAPGGMDF